MKSPRTLLLVLCSCCCLLLYSALTRAEDKSPKPSGTAAETSPQKAVPSPSPSESPANVPSTLNPTPQTQQSTPASISPSASAPPSPSPKQATVDDYSGKTVKDPAFASRMMQARNLNVPKVGDTAYDFELKVFGKKSTLKLSSFKGKKPVVLVLSSYT